MRVLMDMTDCAAKALNRPAYIQYVHFRNDMDIAFL